MALMIKMMIMKLINYTINYHCNIYAYIHSKNTSLTFIANDYEKHDVNLRVVTSNTTIACCSVTFTSAAVLINKRSIIPNIRFTTALNYY